MTRLSVKMHNTCSPQCSYQGGVSCCPNDPILLKSAPMFIVITPRSCLSWPLNHLNAFDKYASPNPTYSSRALSHSHTQHPRLLLRGFVNCGPRVSPAPKPRAMPAIEKNLI